MPGIDDLEKVQVESREDWRQWLHANHSQSESIWLVTFKKASGRPAPSYNDVVEEAICFGWVDSLRRKLDEERTMLLMAPRKTKSAWSASNKDRVATLRARKLMHPSGEETVKRAVENGNWDALNEVEELILPPDLLETFTKYPGSARFFQNFPPSSKRGILEWISKAKSPATRAKRLDDTARCAADNIKANFPRGRNKGPKLKDV